MSEKAGMFLTQHSGDGQGSLTLHILRIEVVTGSTFFSLAHDYIDRTLIQNLLCPWEFPA
jgi:hypothetical protein